MQRSVGKWALLLFLVTQWRERISTLIGVLIAFSVRHCAQFKIRNQSRCFIPATTKDMRESEVFAPFEQSLIRLQEYGMKFTMKTNKRCIIIIIPVLFIVVASWSALSRFPIHRQKRQPWHICIEPLNYSWLCTYRCFPQTFSKMWGL